MPKGLSRLCPTEIDAGGQARRQIPDLVAEGYSRKPHPESALGRGKCYISPGNQHRLE
jgi:hypothetical protein